MADLSPYFNPWFLGLLPIAITFIKTRVPELWREALVAVLAAGFTAFTVLTTDLAWIGGVREGAMLFLALLASRGAVNGVVNVFEAGIYKVPPISKTKVVTGLLLVGLIGTVALAQDSLGTNPVAEPVGETARIWIVFVTQFMAKLLDKWLGRR